MCPPSGTDDDHSGGTSPPRLPDRPRFGGVPERRRRERIVELVDGRGDPYTVGELARRLADWLDAQNDGVAPTEEEVHDVLYSFDLPRLDGEGRLRFDENAGTVSASSAPETWTGPRANDGLDADGGGTDGGRTDRAAGPRETTVTDAVAEGASARTPPGIDAVVVAGGVVALLAAFEVGPLTPTHALLVAGLVAVYALVTSLL